MVAAAKEMVNGTAEAAPWTSQTIDEDGGEGKETTTVSTRGVHAARQAEPHHRKDICGV